MIQQTTAPTVHRVECHAGRPSLISNMRPEQGYSALCHRCRMVHDIPWTDFPSDILRGIVEAINGVMVARGEQGV